MMRKGSPRLMTSRMRRRRASSRCVFRGCRGFWREEVLTFSAPTRNGSVARCGRQSGRTRCRISRKKRTRTS